MKKNILTVSAISVIISSVFNAEASGQSTANANVENPGVTAPSSPTSSPSAQGRMSRILSSWPPRTSDAPLGGTLGAADRSA